MEGDGGNGMGEQGAPALSPTCPVRPGMGWDGMEEAGEMAAGTGWPFAMSTCPPAHIAALADACRAPCIPCFCPSLWQTAPQSRMLPAAIGTEPCMAARRARTRRIGSLRPLHGHLGSCGRGCGTAARRAGPRRGQRRAAQAGACPTWACRGPRTGAAQRPGRRRYLHGTSGRCGPRRRCMGTMIITPGGAALPGWKKRTAPPTASGSGSWRGS